MALSVQSVSLPISMSVSVTLLSFFLCSPSLGDTGNHLRLYMEWPCFPSGEVLLAYLKGKE